VEKEDKYLIREERERGREVCYEIG